MKKIGVILILIIFLLNLSFISALIVNEKAVDGVLVSEFNQPARFTLEIEAGANESGNYYLYTLSDVRMMPKDSFFISPGKNEVPVYLYQMDSLNVRGSYSLMYRLKSGDFVQEEVMTVKVEDLKNIISVNSDSNDFGKDSLTFYIENKENKELDGVNVRFVSQFFDVTQKVDIKPSGKTEITLPVSREKLAGSLAGSYLLDSTFETDKGPVAITGKIYIGEKKSIKTDESSSGLIIRTTIITKNNVGNVPETTYVKVRKNILSRLFVSMNIEPETTERKGVFVYYSWSKTLNPGESFTVKVTTNYILPLLIIIFALVILYLVRRQTDKDIEVKKSVSHVKTRGGEFALKVSVKVRAKKAVSNVSLIDRIPSIVKLYESHFKEKPKIDYTNRRLQWDFGEMGSGEERDVSYIVYSKVGIVGKFSLPEALAVFEENGEVHEVESNRVFFLSEQVKSDDYEEEREKL